MAEGVAGLLRDKTRPSRIPALGSEVVEQVVGCCQSNRNSSPIGAAIATEASAQAISICHSASAAERRVL